MSNKYLFPQKIYLENETIINDLNIFFDLANVGNEKLKVGDWLNLDGLKMKGDFINGGKKALNVEQKNESTNLVIKREYVVKPLDTFFIVARRLNITETYLRKLAKTKNLYIGQKIVIEHKEIN